MKLEYTVFREHRARAEARARFDYDGISEEMFLKLQQIHEAAKRIVALDPTDPHMTLLERELLDRAISDMEKAIAQFRTGEDLVRSER